jgi:molybdopterin converting factor small subunit
MATIHFPNDLSEHTGGLEAVVIAAPRVQELLEAVVSRFPGLAPVLCEMAVAVDGEIYQEADYVPLRPESEVHLVPRTVGG